jgi:hypothetical protein
MLEESVTDKKTILYKSAILVFGTTSNKLPRSGKVCIHILGVDITVVIPLGKLLMGSSSYLASS